MLARMSFAMEVVTNFREVAGEQAGRTAGASNVYKCQSGAFVLLMKTNI